jgi:ethanolaminephosphotransferase
MILSGYYGPEMWSTPLIAHFPSLEQYIGQTTFRDLWVPILISSFLIAHLPACIVNVSRARRAQNLSIAPLFVEWTPIIIFVVSTAAWLGSPYSNLLNDNHLVLFCLTMSLVFGRMTTKIILAHLTHQPFPMYTVMLTPLVIAGVVINLPYFPIIGELLPPISTHVEQMYLWGYFVFAAVVYANWAILVISRICEYLGINCLTIPTKAPVSEKSGMANGATNGSIGKGRKD